LLKLFLIALSILIPLGLYAPASFELRISLNKSIGDAYIEGENILISVETSKTSYLQLYYHDASGASYLIFPNDGSDPKGQIAGGKKITVGKGVDIDGFEFEVTAPFGGEMIRAYASTHPLPIPKGEKLDGGMIHVKASMDKIDMDLQDAAAKLKCELTNTTTLLKTTAKQSSIAKRASETDVYGMSKGGFAKPRIFALVVGISKYSSSKINALRYAETDANMVAHFLQSPHGAGVAKENILTLINEKATRNDILGALQNFLAKSGKNDLIILYLAGHGLSSPESNATYFLSHDTDLKNLSSTAVDQEEITSILTEKVKAGKIVVFLDACHGGGLGLTGVRMRGASTVLSSRMLTELVSKKNGTAFFSASRAMEQSQEGQQWGGGHGVFTHYLVDGLQKNGDLNGDGRVTIDELGEFVTKKVKDDTRGSQHPELKGYFDNDLVLSVLR